MIAVSSQSGSKEQSRSDGDPRLSWTASACIRNVLKALVVKRREREAGGMSGALLPRLMYTFMAW